MLIFLYFRETRRKQTGIRLKRVFYDFRMRFASPSLSRGEFISNVIRFGAYGGSGSPHDNNIMVFSHTYIYVC